MDLDQALDFLAAHSRGVLATIKRDGRPQLSNVTYLCRGDLVRVSVTDDRAKTRNLRRDPRASLHVTTDRFWPYLVAEGTAEVGERSSEQGDPVGRELAEVYEQIAGPHPDWDEFYRAMVEERRAVLSFRVERAYGIVPGPT
ncbi:MAG: PPOX class F420-dependent oxidoreductase [Acidimicrobiia bacterium]